MKETKKYDNWMKFLTVSVIVIIVCVFTLTVTDTHLAKRTYAADTCTCPNGGSYDKTTGLCTKACYSTKSSCESGGWSCSEKTTNDEEIVWYFCTSNANCSPATGSAGASCNGVTSFGDPTACRAKASSTSVCPNGFDGCGSKDENGCYTYTCKSASDNCRDKNACMSVARANCGNLTPVCEDNDKDGCYTYYCSGTSPSGSVNCDVSVSTSSVLVSVDSDNVDNSYYTVNVSYSGSGCEGQIITYSATNAKKLSSTSYKITSSSTSGTTTFDVYPSDPCVSSVATAKLTNGKSASTSAVSTRTDWVSYADCVENPTYKSFAEADRAGSNVYYSDPIGCNGHSGWYTKKWVRNGCGGGGGNSGSDPTPTSSSSYACYLVNHKYVWASSKPSGGTLVSSITNESKCSGCESSYTPDNNNNCVKPSSNPSSNVPVNPKTGTVGIIIAWIVGLTAIVYTLWYFKKSSSIK